MCEAGLAQCSTGSSLRKGSKHFIAKFAHEKEQLRRTIKDFKGGF